MKKNKLVLVKFIISVIAIILCTLRLIGIINFGIPLVALAAGMVVEALIEWQKSKKLNMWIYIALAMTLIIIAVENFLV